MIITWVAVFIINYGGFHEALALVTSVQLLHTAEDKCEVASGPWEGRPTLLLSLRI